MGWEKNQGNKGDGDAPATSFVRLPDKADRPAPRPADGGQGQPAAWTPSHAPRPASGAPVSSGDGSPFGGFHAGSNTGMVRRESSRGRALAVLGVVFAVLILGGLSVWLAVVVLKPTPPPATPTPQTGLLTDPNGKPPVVDYVDDDDDDDVEVPETPPPSTGKTTKSGSTGHSSTGKASTGKSSTGTTSTGKTSTGKASTGKTSTTGRTPGNPRGTATDGR